MSSTKHDQSHQTSRSDQTDDLIVPVGDLLGASGRKRAFSGSQNVELRLGETRVHGPMTVAGEATGMIHAVSARFTTSADGQLTCTRCLKAWTETIAVEGEQYFGVTPDENGYAIVGDTIDVSGPAKDELALALPAVPLCREACEGLCPTCGTDLNSDPCGGHGEESDSPFAVLKDLFDS